MKKLQIQSSKNFCHFCKKEISGKGDKEKIYHLSCFNLVTNFEKKNKKKEELFSILQKQFPYDFFLDTFETISEIGDFEAPGMSLTKLDDSFSCLIDLRYLNLSNNKLTDLPMAIKKLNKIVTIKLNDNNFRSLPKVITKLRKIKTLEIKNNLLTFLPKSIGNLTELETLDISNNQIERLPDEIKDLDKIKFFNVSRNILSDIPEIDSWKDLFYINLSYNKLNRFPASLKMITTEILHLDFNDIRIVPKELFYEENNAKNIHSCTKISLNSCKLKFLPDIKINSKIQYLYARNNEIRELPKSFGESRNLMILDISHNPIDQLPDQLFSHNGKKLYANFTKLNYLSDDIKNVNTIHIRGTMVEEFPEFTNLKRLWELDISETNIEKIPHSMKNFQIDRLYITNKKLIKYFKHPYTQIFFNEIPKYESEIIKNCSN